MGKSERERRAPGGEEMGETTFATFNIAYGVKFSYRNRILTEEKRLETGRGYFRIAKMWSQ